MESKVVTKAFLARALDDLQRRMTQRLESSIANAQAQTLYWMVGIFLAATALVGTAVSVYAMAMLSRF